MRAAREAARAQQEASNQENEKKDEKKEETKEGDEKEKKEDAVPTVKRPTEPPQKGDRDELDVKPDERGFVQFSFNGQRWQDVLQWYADAADLSLDWQELPADYLNLVARRPYTLAETGDILNARLLARGFTMTKSGDVLSVLKVDKLDPSLIRRVEPDDLEDYSPHDFVRMRLELPDTMDPTKAAEDVKVLLSPHAKVQPLLATKRLHIVDAVINLRNVRDLIYAERAAVTEDIRPVQFMIRHRRADYIADQVMIVLGLDPASRKTPQELQIEQQRIQLAMAMMKQKKDVSGMIKQGGPDVFIAVNQRRNSILVNAAPAEMAKIQRTIEMLDVPDDGGEVWASGGSRPEGGELEFKKYVTATASTDAVVSALKEIGRLHPLTQLQSDKPNRTIYATATAADHEKIQSMIDRLDGTGRQLHVIWLNKRSPADQIAGTINLLMGVNEEKNDDNGGRSRRYYYYGYGYNNDDEEADAGEMRIQPDIEHNRLLLWANDSEYEEVVGLLEKIGALDNPERGNRSLVRVHSTQNPQAIAELLERLQDSWSGDNPIEVHGLPKRDRQDQDNTESQEPSSKEVEDKVTGVDATKPFQLAKHDRRHRPTMRLVEGAGPDPGEAKAPPIQVTVTPDGRLILTSDDPAALDRVEELLAELEPPAPEFVEYRLRHTRASLVEILLSEYFEDELKGQTENVYDQWGEYEGKRDKDMGPTTLGRRRLLRFIWDNDSNTIIVQNASAAQLKIIDKLIKIYDEPPDQDSVAARRTEVVSLRYSQAKDIATSLKDVFRDLLSSKDKEFQGRDGEQGGRTETHYRFIAAAPSRATSTRSRPLSSWPSKGRFQLASMKSPTR